MNDPEPVDPAGDYGDPGDLPGSAQGSVSYVHDPAVVPRLAQLVDAACEGIEYLHDPSHRVRKLADQVGLAADDPAVIALVRTFAYVLQLNTSDQPGAELAPLDGPSWMPEALRDASVDLKTLWVELSTQVTHPVARARLFDITFTLRLGDRPHESAQHTAPAYRDTVGGSLRSHDQSYGLLRAWTLARRMNLPTLEQDVTVDMLDMVEQVLTDNDYPYGAIRLLEALIVPSRKNRAQPKDPRVDDLLDRALLTYPEVHVIKDVAVLVRRRAVGDKARITHASRVEVEAMLADARAATEPLITRYLFSEAASAARRLELPDLEEIAVAHLQAAPAVDWQTTRTEINFPTVLFVDFMRPFEKAANWPEALAAWCHTEAPSGHHPSNLATAKRVQQISVIRSAVTNVVFRDGDLPKRTLSSGNALIQHELARVEIASVKLRGIMLADALDLIKTRFGIPTRDDVQKFIGMFGTQPTLARSLATAFQLYWTEDYDATAHLVVPKVETAARALLLELNEPLYRATVGDTSGQFPALGTLLGALLACDFDPDWDRFLRTFLLNDGSNIRNYIAHGFTDTIDRTTAALALRAGRTGGRARAEHADRGRGVRDDRLTGRCRCCVVRRQAGEPDSALPGPASGASL